MSKRFIMKILRKRIFYFLIQWQNVLATAFSLLVLAFLIFFFRYQLPGFIIRRHEIAVNLLELRGYVRSYGLYSQFVFVGWYMVSNILFFPIFVLSLAGGLIFHPLHATGVAFLALFFSLQVYYWLGRCFGSRFVNWWGYKEEKLFEAEEFDLNFKSLLFCRFNFFIPIHALGAVSGAHRVPFFTFISSTLAGLSTRIIVYSLLGTALRSDERYFFSAVFVWACFIVIHALFGYWHIGSYLKGGLPQKGAVSPPGAVSKSYSFPGREAGSGD
ncbi:MAG: TVP38/TMEM64 family protein [bacterium]